MNVDPELVDWAFKALVTGSVVYGVRVLSQLQKSVETLNVNVAVVIEKVAGHEKVLDKHDVRIQNLEQVGG